MTAFIEEHREKFGVEPICKAMDFAPSTTMRRSNDGRSRRRGKSVTGS